MKLNTRRLTLRAFLPEDAARLQAWLGDADTAAALWMEPLTPEGCVREAKRRAKDEQAVAVCLADTGAPIGELLLTPAGQDAYELRFALAPEQQGRAYATEAARALLNHAFAEGGAHRVAARVEPGNRKALRLLRRLGFRREGCLRADAFYRTEPDTGAPLWHDTCMYAVLREDWLKRM